MVFRYQPLDPSALEIRLARIEPGGWEDDIRLSLWHARLDSDEKPAYEALSYTWGDVDDKAVVSIDGQEFPVTTNLRSALQHLRRFEHYVIWVDAICINQNDIPERSQQIQRMRLIYDAATQVVAFLGPEDDDSALAIEKMAELWSIHGQSVDRPLHEVIHWGNPELFGDPGQPFDYRPWRAIELFFQRPWFSRTWVVQEASIGGDIQFICGNHKIWWPAVTVAVLIPEDLLAMRDAEKSPACECIRAVRKSGQSWFGVVLFRLITRLNDIDDPRRWPILELMEKFQYLDATDPRDKLYAPLGFAADIETHELLPDYSRPLIEVYGGLVECCISKQHNLDVLGYCMARDPSSADLPSWIPDWRHKSTRHPFRKRATSDRVTVYKTSGNTKPVVRFLDGFKAMVCRGFQFDVIRILGGAKKYHHTSDSGGLLFMEETLKVIGSLSAAPAYDLDTGLPFDWVWDKEAKEPGSVTTRKGIYHITGQTISSAINHTVVADCHPGSSAENGRRGYFFTGDVYDEHGKQSRDQFAVYRTIHTRRLFSSHKGYLGVAPEEALEGDVICVLWGGEVPFVLRMTGDGHYGLIGECYVHGIMDGEAMKEVEQGRLPLQDFVMT